MTDDKENETSLSAMVGQLPAYHSTEDLNQSTSLDYMTGIFSPGRATEEQRTDGCGGRHLRSTCLHAVSTISCNLISVKAITNQQTLPLIYKKYGGNHSGYFVFDK